jgi:hypothetical protein
MTYRSVWTVVSPLEQNDMSLLLTGAGRQLYGTKDGNGTKMACKTGTKNKGAFR